MGARRDGRGRLEERTMELTPETDVRFLKGVGPARAEILESIGVRTVGDLLEHYPRRYLDRRHVRPIASVRVGETVTVVGTVRECTLRRTKTGRRNLHVLVSDDTGSLECVFFNQPFRERHFRVGTLVMLSGEVRYFGGVQLSSPDYEALSAEETELLHTGRIVPIYPLVAGIGQRTMRSLVSAALQHCLEKLSDPLPASLRGELDLMALPEAVANMHFPPGWEEFRRARRRVAFEELFYLQLVFSVRRARMNDVWKGIAFQSDADVAKEFLKRLPFDLTHAQKRAISEIGKDMGSRRVMHRLLEGDVGSGKTVVALWASLTAVGNGYQVAFMAPTEILAEQHFDTIKKLVGELPVTVELLTGRQTGKLRNGILERMAAGEVQIVVGTQALIQGGVAFKKLGLVIVDEQHRFGVLQRMGLKGKGVAPDFLVMSATPIPRTLALSVYGDLDVSVLDDMPPGRAPVVTRLTREQMRERVYQFVAGELAKGRQAYHVYPVIESSEKLELKAAKEMARKLASDRHLGRYRIGLIHGRMRPREKEQAMRDFARGATDVLVSTTVIEVGIDVPNASVMIIEHPERYGLAQLHQLRGRIGRGSHKSYCILIASGELNPEAEKRLESFVSTTDGFQIAQADLALRGPGQFMGLKQHGLAGLKVADLVRDAELVRLAREWADSIAAKDYMLKQFPELRKMLKAKYGGRAKLADVG